MRILVTGGSGFIGTNAVDYLIESGIECINFDLKEPQKTNHLPYWKKVDIRNKTELDSAIANFKPSHVLHLAAMTGMNISDMDYFAANTVGVENLIHSLTSIKEIKRIVFTSSLLVCRNGYIPNNYDDYCPPNLYGKSKVIGEKIVKNTKANFSWSIVRPTSIWGPYFKDSYRSFFGVINKGYYFHPNNLEIYKPKSYVGNTVYMMFQILFEESGNVEKKTFYLSDYPYTTTREWADLIKSEMDQGKVRSIPLWLYKYIAIIGDIAKILHYQDPPISSFRLNNMLTGGIYPIENTKEICGDLPFTLKQGVQNTIRWLKYIKEIT